MSERDEVVRRWRRGEELLYPVATVRPDLYQASSRLVRSLADILGGVPDVDALVATFRSTDLDADLATAGVERSTIPPDVPLDLVRDSAYALRARVLVAREATDRTLGRIVRARNAGDRTVTIWAEGENDRWPPYRRVEMSLATGRAISESTTLDADTMEPIYVLEAIELDPKTGEAASNDPIVPRREFTDHEAWRSAADELRQALLKD
jgi:hypothetical protein